MEDDQLEELLRGLESDRIEFKPSGAQGDKIRQAICAFANDLPNHNKAGVIFVGINDEGNCVNLDITDQLLKNLSSMRSDGNITPFPRIDVQKRVLNGCELAVVIVQPADAPPVRYQGTVYVRVGPSNRPASPQEERELTEKRRSRDLPFDLKPITSATLSDLDLNICQEYMKTALPVTILDQNQRSLEHQLSSLRLTTQEPDITPTVLGMVVAGVEPRRFIPGAYIQFLRMQGQELTTPVKAENDIDGSLAVMLRSLDEVFRAHISTAVEIPSDSIEHRQPDYPLVALVQLARNAVLHRTYEGTSAPVRIYWFEDRIEIQSPGGPYGQVTMDNFGQPGITDYRNPNLAEAMRNLGYVQRFGMGIQMARDAMLSNGNPAPEFVISQTHVLVVLRRTL